MMETAKITFKTEWTEADFKIMKRAIKRNCDQGLVWSGNEEKTFDTYDGFDNWAGLAYTSSSSFAGLWICNGVDIKHRFYPSHRYVGFAISVGNIPYAILWDKDENEILVKIK